MKLANQVLKITNFGPIRDVELAIRPFTCLIGPQGAGKSTVAKLLFLFKSARAAQDRAAADWVLTGTRPAFAQWIVKELEELASKTWGTWSFAADSEVLYRNQDDPAGGSFTLHWIDGRPRISLSDGWKARIAESEQLVAENLICLQQNLSEGAWKRGTPEVFPALQRSILDRLEATAQVHTVYIPAMRAMLHLLNKKTSFFDQSDLDPTIPDFYRKSYSSLYGRPLADNEVEPWQRKAEAIERAILGAGFDAGEFVGEGHRTSYDQAASGQQAAIWVTHPLIRFPASNQWIVEEPEAHLFPEAQRKIVELMALVHNSRGSRFLIATHSPYIVAAINNLVYASALAARSRRGPEIAEIVDQDLWLDPTDVGGYLLEGGKASPLPSIPDGDGELDFAHLDAAMHRMNEDFDRLLKFEPRAQQV